MTTFQIGDKVKFKAHSDSTQARHLDRTKPLTVAQVRTEDYAWGTFVGYLVRDQYGAQDVIVNGHLVLELVHRPSTGKELATKLRELNERLYGRVKQTDLILLIEAAQALESE